MAAPRARRLLVLVAILLALSAVGGAWWWERSRVPAVPSQDDVLRGVMARVDRDHDGRLSREEWLSHGGEESMFTQYDADQDGFLNLEEFRTMFLTTDPIWINGR